MAAKLVPSHLPASRLSPLLRLGQSSCRRREGTLTKQQGNVKPYFCLGYIASQKCSAVILTARKTMFALATWRSSLANILTAASRLLSRKSQSREMVFSCFRGRSAFVGGFFLVCRFEAERHGAAASARFTTTPPGARLRESRAAWLPPAAAAAGAARRRSSPVRRAQPSSRERRAG